MENNTQIGKGIYYSHLQASDKHYFGGFFNLAQINIDGVAKEFCTRTGTNTQVNKPIHRMKEYFNDKASLTDWERGISVLKEYWPFVQYIDLAVTDKRFEIHSPELREEAKRQHFRTSFVLLLDAIGKLRHYYTHYFHEPIVLDNELFELLDALLVGVAVEELKTKMKDDKTRQLLKEGIAAELDILRKLKKEDLKKKKLEGKRVSERPEDIENAIYNDAFGHILYKAGEPRQYVLKDVRRSRGREEDIASTGIQLSESGIIFLLSMFLSRKEVEQLKSNIKGYKGKVLDAEKEVTVQFNSLKFMATHWVYSRLAFKGLKQRLTTTFEKETLLMQVVDELSKVPDEVYRTLSEGDKKQFVEDMNEYWSDTKDSDEGLYVVHPVIRKRYESKFNYFALRYLDEFAGFPTLRFQVFAGQYVHDNREKQLAGGEHISNRMIKEKINVFGRLSEITDRKTDHFDGHPDEDGWELFPVPSYNWVGNNIPVYIDLASKGKEPKAMFDEIVGYRQTLNPHKDRKLRCTKEEILQRIYPAGVVWGDPTLLLSANELMALLHEHLVRGKSGAELEEMMVQKLLERYQLIKAYEPDGEPVDKSVIPARLQASDKDSGQLNLEKLLEAIRREVAVSDQKLEMIQRYKDELYQTEKARKKGTNALKNLKVKRNHLFYASEMGKEATWIANDLKRFMPLNARALWKGNQHSELQKLLAFYETERIAALALIESVWPLNAADVFAKDIKTAFGCRNFVDFYTQYLQQRRKVLIAFTKTLTGEHLSDAQRRAELKKIFVVFDRRLYRINATDKQKAELLAKPMAFPRGLFDGKPTVIEGVSVNDAPAQFADWYSYGYQYAGRFQSYYALPKEYLDYFKQQKEAGKFDDWENKTGDEMLERFRLRCDQSIRKVKFQDVYLKLIVDSLYGQVFGMVPDFDLSMMYDTPEERRQNSAKALLQKDRAVGDDSENLRKENYILNKTVTVSLYNGQIQEAEVKLKDVGKFRRFAADSKVISLLNYAPERVWAKQEIENELENRSDSYEAIRRTKLLKTVHQLEKWILAENGFDGHTHPADLMMRGNPNFRMYLCKGLLPRVSGVKADELAFLSNAKFEEIEPAQMATKSELIQKSYLLILLRNKFGHNQLPKPEAYRLMLGLFAREGQESYSGYFNRVVQQIIAEFSALK